jgi:hypothetical protein
MSESCRTLMRLWLSRFQVMGPKTTWRAGWTCRAAWDAGLHGHEVGQQVPQEGQEDREQRREEES